MTDIEALIADLRRDAHEPGVAPATALQAADVLESVAAERDRLGEALFEAYLATGADPDGATDWQGLFRPMTRPSWGAALRGEIERIQAEADSDVERAETERDAYKKAKQENDERFMRERDEARAERDALRAIIDEALATTADNHQSASERVFWARRILSRATTTKKGTEA